MFWRMCASDSTTQLSLSPIGASSGGNMVYPASLAQLCDWSILVQGNGVSPDQKRARLRELRSNLRPVWMIEDDKRR